jgi:hypothetical protein
MVSRCSEKKKKTGGGGKGVELPAVRWGSILLGFHERTDDSWFMCRSIFYSTV